MKKLILPLILLFALSNMVLAQGTLNRTFNGVKKIRMKTASGSCTLVKGTGSEVKVDMTHTFAADDFQPEVSLEGDRLVIREVFNGSTSRGNSYWTLTVPDGIAITFSTGSGSLTASGLSSDIDMNSGSGDISMTQMKGDIRGNTGSGDIDLDRLTGEVKMNTGSGDIEIRNSGGELNVSCGSGDIKIADSKAVFSANTGSGKIVSRNITLDGSSHFNAGSGDAEVVLAASPKFDIAVNSGSGDARLDFNGNKIVGEVVMKANKRNGEIKAPFEFDTTEETNEYGDQVIVKKTAIRGNGDVKIAVGTGSGAAVLK